MTQKYKAFISYSHKDRQWAAWLHKRLEAYRFPKNIIGQKTNAGLVPTSLRPIFRDRDELTAGADLGQKIEAALQQTENLIVICSPQSATSHWVNEEILFFKRHNRGANIFAVIVDGEPFASGDNTGKECFPPALRFKLGDDEALSNTPAEPLAADLREIGDGKRLGLLKLISGIAGLGLDDLVQRDLQRARRRVTAVTTSAVAAMLVMGSLTWLAVDARGEADKRRNNAEGLAEFMLTDLKDKLQPIGKLDVMDGVAQEVLDYYDSYSEKGLSCEAITRKGQALALNLDISRDKNAKQKQLNLAKKSYLDFKPLVPNCPNSQKPYGTLAFHLGHAHLLAYDVENAEKYFQESLNIFEALKISNVQAGLEIDDDIEKDIANAWLAVGASYFDKDDFETAILYIKKAQEAHGDRCDFTDYDEEICFRLANIFGWMALTYENLDDINSAISFRLQEIQVATKMQDISDVSDWGAMYLEGSSRWRLATLYSRQNLLDKAEIEVSLSDSILTKLVNHDRENMTWLRAVLRARIIRVYLANDSPNSTKSITANTGFKEALDWVPEDTRDRVDSMLEKMKKFK